MGAGVCPAAGQHLIPNNPERLTRGHTPLKYFIIIRNYNHQNAFRTAHSKTSCKAEAGATWAASIQTWRLPALLHPLLLPALLHHRSSSSNVSMHLNIIISSSTGRSGSCKTQVEEDSILFKGSGPQAEEKAPSSQACPPPSVSPPHLFSGIFFSSFQPGS